MGDAVLVALSPRSERLNTSWSDWIGFFGSPDNTRRTHGQAPFQAPDRAGRTHHSHASEPLISPVDAQEGPKTHIVREGETISGIAELYGITVDALLP